MNDKYLPSLRGAKRRSNPFLICGPMDCFAALAMTVVRSPTYPDF
jgi:hypothetical protein